MSPRTPLTPDNDLDGYDESQRAEIHEYEGGGPVDGLIRTDMAHDRGGDLDDELDGKAPEMPDRIEEGSGAPLNDPDDDGLDVDDIEDPDGDDAVLTDADGDDTLIDGQGEDDSSAL